MKKAILFALVAFLLSTGGTTAYIVKTAPPPPAPAPSRPDSAAHDSTPADSTGHAPHGGDSASRTTAGDSAGPAAHDSAAPAGTAPASPAPAPPPRRGPPPVDPEARAAANKQVARVLSAMKAPEAAKVLAYLTDDEVEGILRAVGPRQAADFLTNLPKERAAALSRRLLKPKGDAK